MQQWNVVVRLAHCEECCNSCERVGRWASTLLRVGKLVRSQIWKTRRVEVDLNVDWLQLRGIAKSDCAIVPTQEIAAYPWCSACGRLGSGERLTARWALPTFGGLVPCNPQDTRTIPPSQNQYIGSGTSTWLEGIARVCPNLRFRFSLLCHSSRGSFCKSSSALTVRFSLDGPSTEVTSPSSTSPLSGAPREPKASSSFTSLPTTDSQTSGNESSQRRTGIQFASCGMDPLLAHSSSVQRATTTVLAWRGAGQAVGGGHPRAPSMQAALWAPSMNERDIILEALAEIPSR